MVTYIFEKKKFKQDKLIKINVLSINKGNLNTYKSILIIYFSCFHNILKISRRIFKSLA